MADECVAYRNGEWVCANGFPQLPACHSGVGSFGARRLPYCLHDELPEHWINDDGSPRFYRGEKHNG